MRLKRPVQLRQSKRRLARTDMAHCSAAMEMHNRASKGAAVMTDETNTPQASPQDFRVEKLLREWNSAEELTELESLLGYQVVAKAGRGKTRQGRELEIRSAV